MFSVGQRVEVHPATDAFMMGDRYGVVEKVYRPRTVQGVEPHNTQRVHVRMGRSGKVRRFHVDNLYEVG